jgi:hypothetical protein
VRRRQQQQQQQYRHQQLQQRLQVTAQGRPSLGITSQDLHAAEIYARQALRPGW